MIEAKQVSKYYEDIKALDQVSVTINEGNVFGLVGTNGAGKSTFMRILSGVLKADQGEITIDGHPVYENMEAKSQVFYISDDQYFFLPEPLRIWRFITGWCIPGLTMTGS